MATEMATPRQGEGGRISVHFGRKQGLSGYSSVCADVTLEISAPRGASGDELAELMRETFGAASRAVAERIETELETLQPATAAPDPLPISGGSPAAAAKRPESRRAGAGGPSYQTPYKHTGYQTPRTGPQLYAWAKRTEQQKGTDGQIIGWLAAYGEEEGWGRKMYDWTPEQIGQAYRAFTGTPF